MPKRLSEQERLWREIPEKQHQASIIKLAELYGWKVVHFSDSRAINKKGQAFGDKQAAGWPDLFCVRPPEIVVIECKKELGKTTENQDEWLALFEACGIDTYVSRPSTFEIVQERLTRARPV